MAERPTGTSTDEDRLLELRPREALVGDADATGDAYAVAVTDLVERVGLSGGAPVDWSADERDEDPMLVVGPIDDAEADDAAYPRRLVAAGDETVVPVPEALLARELGLDLAAYDPGVPLLFTAVATEETIGLVPVRFADGTPFAPEPLPETPTDSDPVAEETLAHEGGDATPRPETADAPIDADLIAAVADETGVSLDALVDALQTIHRDDLVGVEDVVPGYDPLSVGNRAVCVLPDDAWEAEIGPELGTDREVREAAATVHERQARRLVDEAGAPDYHDVGDHALAVAGERDTAEWEVTGADGV